MERSRRLAALAGALLLGPSGPAGAAAPNWADEKSELTATPAYARSKAVCRRLGDPRPPKGDQPTPAQAKALKGCSAETLYYGEGTRPDYAKARLCAFMEADGGDDQVFGGSTILMQLYANGLDVVRNLDLAAAYACRIEGAPAEIDGRVLHVQALEAKGGRLDYCDDVTSGLAEGYCRSRSSSQAGAVRDAKLASLIAALPAEAKRRYPSMKKAFDAFVNAHGDGEVDLSGTARAALEIEEEDGVRDQFLKDLSRLVSGAWPDAADADRADAKLNESYRRALAWAGGKDNDTTIKPQDVRRAQRAWLAYRDAFFGFASAAAPGVKRAAALARLSNLRTAELDQLHD